MLYDLDVYVCSADFCVESDRNEFRGNVESHQHRISAIFSSPLSVNSDSEQRGFSGRVALCVHYSRLKLPDKSRSDWRKASLSRSLEIPTTY